MESVLQDLRQAGRALRKSPLFTGLAGAALALGIGSAAMILTVVDRVLLRPLPYRDSQALVKVWERNDVRHFDRNLVDPQNFLDWRDRAKSFQGLAAYTWSSMVLTDGDVPERVLGRAVTPNMFTVLGAAPAMGRVFTEAEARPHSASVIILSDGLWRRRFGADPNVVGKTVHAADGDATVIGVMPAGFRPLGNEEYWDPFRLDPAVRQRSGRYAMVVGRLARGTPGAAAQTDMDGIARALALEYPEGDAGWGVSVVPMRDDVVQQSRTVLWMVFGAVALVLLITCANVGNLLLTRALSRRREMAVRRALGATRWRIAQQWILENLILAAGSGAAGLLLATNGIALLVAAKPSEVPRVGEIAIDARVLVLVTALTLGVGILIALPALLQGTSARLSAALHGDSTRTTGSARVSRFRAALVIAQMSLAVVLLFGSGLLVRSIARLSQVEPGFDPNGVLSVGVGIPDARWPSPAKQYEFVTTLATRVAGLPGVRSVGAVNLLPLSGMDAATSFTAVDQPRPEVGKEPVAAIRITGPGYFETMRIPLERGRFFTAADRDSAPPVVIVSQALARAIWPDQDPIGRHLQIAWRHPEQQPEVVGVVGDVHATGLDAESRQTIYYPIAQQGSGYITMVVRSDADAGALAPAVRAAIREMDRTIPAEDMATMTTWITRSMADRRDPMILLSLFAALAVTIAAVGVYAVLSFGVAQRTREIGVRIALGALPGEVIRMVLRDGLRLAAVGIALGLVAGTLASRVLGKLLFEVTPGDPLAIAAVTVLLIVVALLATWLPARRAARVDPMVALRTE